jgi:hypothetical protein
MAAMRSGARSFRRRNGICCNNILNKTPPFCGHFASRVVNQPKTPPSGPLHGYRPIPITGH